MYKRLVALMVLLHFLFNLSSVRITKRQKNNKTR